MIKRHSLYVALWRECLDQGYSSNDARAYAQLEIERLDREDKASAPAALLPASTEALGPPAPIRQHILSVPKAPKTPNTTRISDKIKPPSFPMPTFIKPNSRSVDKMKTTAQWRSDDPDMMDEDDWRARYGQYD